MSETIFAAMLGITGGLVCAVIGAYIGYLGALKGAKISKDLSLQLEKSRNAVALYNEFLLPDMEFTREDASDLIKANNNSSEPKTYQQMHHLYDKKSLVSISRLIHFWEKVNHLVENNFIDSALTEKLLSHYFNSHYDNFLNTFANLCLRDDNENYKKWAVEVEKLATKWRKR